MMIAPLARTRGVRKDVFANDDHKQDINQDMFEVHYENPVSVSLFALGVRETRWKRYAFEVCVESASCNTIDLLTYCEMPVVVIKLG